MAAVPEPRVRLEVRLPFTPPLEPSNLYGHLVATGVPGVEEWHGSAYRAALRLERGVAIVAVGLPDDDAIPLTLLLEHPDDAAQAVGRVRRALDLDTDPAPEIRLLGTDDVVGPLVKALPGRRVPGTLDPEQFALRAVLGQQVSTAAARTHAGRLAAALGTPIRDPEGRLTRVFPRPADLLVSEDALASVARMPGSRRSTLLGVARALADGTVRLDAGSEQALAALAAIPGIGPWTLGTIAMRALGERDAFLPGDLGVRVAAERLGLPAAGRALEAASRAWSPFRAVAVQYLWATLPHAVNTLPPAEPST